MRVFDWFISGAVALLYSQLASDEQVRDGIGVLFDPERDTTLGIVYSIGEEWFINWPSIFSAISVICFVAAFWKLRKKTTTKELAGYYSAIDT